MTKPVASISTAQKVKGVNLKNQNEQPQQISYEDNLH
jgi:hypothetical protein